jgi:hypothetical protein
VTQEIEAGKSPETRLLLERWKNFPRQQKIISIPLFVSGSGLRADQAGAADNDNLHFELLILFGRPRRLKPREVADHEEQVQEPEGEPDRRDDTKSNQEQDQTWR